MKQSLEESIFQKGSTTYYWSSKFFPSAVRDDVFKFYSFVRVADDYVDSVPVQADKFYALRQAWDAAKVDPEFNTVRRPKDTVDERVIKNIIDVIRNYDCDPAWIEAFLDAMQSDLHPVAYRTIDDTLSYIYGSAEVVGLIMSKIMGLPDEAQQAARLQGRAMQFINFIRDINEDTALGRCYFPLEDMEKCQLPDLTYKTATQQPEAFNTFMQLQIDRYKQWQLEATQGFSYIPKRLRVPLQTAVDMYNWTVQQIEKNPKSIFDKKIKPRKSQVILRAASNFIAR